MPAKPIDRLTLIYPYYENPCMLGIQLAHWQSYPKKLLEKCRFVIIDDGSPGYPAFDVIGKNPKLPLILYRINENIPWNQHGARNLGAKVIKADWLFMSDMDLVLDADNAQRLLQTPVYDSAFYKFGRVKMPAWEIYKQHCNTFMVRKEHYWSIGGYDEDYCGGYGGDGPFVKGLEQRYKHENLNDIFVKFYGRTYVHDSGTNEFDRTGELRDEYLKVSDRKRRENDVIPHDPIRFTWDRQI